MWDKPQLLNGMANLLFAAAVLLLLYGGVFLIVHLPVFPIREVRLKGQLQHVTREQIGLIVQRELKGNIFTLDIDRVRAAFEKMPWVRDVSVRRRWPGEVDIGVEEYQPLARWGETGLVSVKGELFQAATDARLPVFEGPDNSVGDVMTAYAMAQQELAPLRLHAIKVVLSARRALELTLDNGLVLELGRDQPQARLQRFVRAYPLTVGKLPDTNRRVDLRYSNGFAIQMASAGTTGTHK